MFHYSLKDVKRRFNRSHLTKVSAKIFSRDYKKHIWLGKTLFRLYPDFIKRKYFTLIFKTMILTALPDSNFCYWHGNFDNTKAATGGALKIQIKVSQNSRENISQLQAC